MCQFCSIFCLTDMTSLYNFNFLDIIHHPVSLFITTSWRLDSCLHPRVEGFLSWAQSIELGPVSVHQNQYKAGYIKIQHNMDHQWECAGLCTSPVLILVFITRDWLYQLGPTEWFFCLRMEAESSLNKNGIMDVQKVNIPSSQTFKWWP